MEIYEGLVTVCDRCSVDGYGHDVLLDKRPHKCRMCGMSTSHVHQMWEFEYQDRYGPGGHLLPKKPWYIRLFKWIVGVD